MAVKKAKPLKLIFSVFLMKTILGLVLSALIPVLLFWFATNSGIVNYANSSELEALSAAEALKNVEDSHTVLGKLSGRIKYLVLDTAGNISETVMNEEEKAAALAYIKVGAGSLSGDVRYLMVEREDGKVLLQYRIGTSFANSRLDELLPSPELLLILCIIVFAVLSSMFQIFCLEKRIRREMSPIFDAADEFAKQNLDYDVGHSDIREFEEVLISFDRMKEELGASLKRQWQIQQEQKEQIAALAHDFKTPMTVTMGNLDLLEETGLDEEQEELLHSAFEALTRMSEYVQLLMEMTMASISYQYCFQEFAVQNFLEEIIKQASVLCKQAGVQLQADDSAVAKVCYGDVQMLERAVMNVLQNAAEHTPKGGSVYLGISSEDAFLKLQIEDEGEGFSERMLQQGTRLFAMDDTSRTDDTHYGMGLYFADSVVKRHGGKMILENSAQKRGAKITIYLKLKKS